jgi:hypothetical protein
LPPVTFFAGDATDLQDASPADYPVIRGPVILSDAIGANVSDALLSPNSYLWDIAKSCIPTCGVKLSFVRNANRIDVLLCFECDILCISRDGRAIGYANFDNAREMFVRAAKQAFPDDEVIQNLKP